MCTRSGERIVNETELLFRHVDPKYLKDGDGISSQVFLPWRKVDDGCLSVDQSSKTTAVASFQLVTDAPPQGFGGVSQCVFAVSVDEVHRVQLEAWSDPVAATETLPENPAHAVIEFGDADKKTREKKAQQLKVFAVTRKRLHP